MGEMNPGKPGEIGLARVSEGRLTIYLGNDLVPEFFRARNLFFEFEHLSSNNSTLYGETFDFFFNFRKFCRLRIFLVAGIQKRFPRWTEQ